jgi:preprotein translocase subunit SecD
MVTPVLNQRIILALIGAISITAAVFIYQPGWHLGLDLAGGAQLIYHVDLSEVEAGDRESVLSGLQEVIERRVNLFGVSEPRVYIQKSGEETRLVAELAGISNVGTAIDEIGTTPFLDFREVEETASTTEFIPTDLTGRYITGAQVAFDNITSAALVSLSFDKEGAKIFEELTKKNLGKPIAVFLDDELITIPVVQAVISGGRAQITGDFTPDEAKELAQRFNAGALPAPIELINQHTVSANLGADSLGRAITAGAIGTVLIAIFMIGYYKRLGIFAVVALVIYITLVLAIFKLIPVTMTLAGIAGFLLSIGMAVDANVLVFERIKEELKRGLQYKDAAEEGFKRAWTSIRDANISTIIVSVTLYYFTSTFIRGFALALLIGVIISMLSAIIITRTMLRVFFKP